MNDRSQLTTGSKALIEDKLRRETDSVSGKKVIEFCCTENSPFTDLSTDFESYICIDNKIDLRNFPDHKTEKQGDHVIPYEEISEDCYFGRFHLVYTIFGFYGRARLADEIMKLRRLIIKGGKMVVIDFSEDGLETKYLKQMKLCGFTEAAVDSFVINGTPAFMISAQK